MSGGEMDYLCFKVQEQCFEKMCDDELNDMIPDLVDLLHALEWWRSGDTNEENYRVAARDFKNRWFGKRDLLLRRKIADKLKQTAEEIESR